MFGFAVIIQDHEYVAEFSFAVMQHATRIRFSLPVVLKTYTMFRSTGVFMHFFVEENKTNIMY